MAPTRILLLPANVAPTTSTPRYLVSAPIQEPRITRVAAASRPTSSRPQAAPKIVDPMAILNPPTNSKPRKRERLTSLTVEEKLNRRKLKNRMAAQTARDRKKERSSGLEECVRQLLEDNKKLQAENNALHSRLASLEQTASRRDAEVDELRRELEDQRRARVSPLPHRMIGVETAAALESAAFISGPQQRDQASVDSSNLATRTATATRRPITTLLPILMTLFSTTSNSSSKTSRTSTWTPCVQPWKKNPEQSKRNATRRLDFPRIPFRQCNDHIYALSSPSGSTGFEGSFTPATSAVSPAMDMEWDMASSSFSPSSLIMADPLLSSPSVTIPFRDDDYEDAAFRSEFRTEPCFDDPNFDAFPSYPDHLYGAAF